MLCVLLIHTHVFLLLLLLLRLLLRPFSPSHSPRHIFVSPTETGTYELVGRRIKVYWARDYRWYEGTISEYLAKGDPYSGAPTWNQYKRKYEFKGPSYKAGMHRVRYDDGDVKSYMLSAKKHELI